MVTFGKTVFFKNTEWFSEAVVAAEISLLNLGNLLKFSCCNKIFSGMVEISEPVSISAM